MKHLRTLALAVAATALCSAAAFACGNAKTTAAAASSGNAKASACCASGKSASKVSATAASHGGSCSAEMAAKCTPEMAAACSQMKGKTTATAASNASGCPFAGAAMAGCTSHGKTSATAAMAAGSASCSAHGKTTMTAGGGCSMHGSATAMHECDACDDMATCESELSAAGARAQVVPLKNGVMYVYTAESTDRVRAVQSAVARGNERARAVLAAGDKAKLCSGCRQMRGAMASGKLVREVVNVETGALTLVTSTDREIVNRIHDIAGTAMAVSATH